MKTFEATNEGCDIEMDNSRQTHEETNQTTEYCMTDKEIRPLVVVDRVEGSNDLTAAIWDDDLGVWVSNEGDQFQGNGPADDPELLVVEKEHTLFDERDLLENHMTKKEDK